MVRLSTEHRRIDDPRSLGRLRVDFLVAGLREARTNAALGQAIADAANRRVGLSSFVFLRASGPVVSPRDLFSLNGRVAPERARALVMEAFRLIDRELEPIATHLASERKSFDIAARYRPETVRRSEVFNAVWRPLASERQLVGFLGPADRPIGYFCGARTQREPPFTARDLDAFETIRAIVERELLEATHVGRGTLDETLAVLSSATPSPWFLFDAAGNLLWLSDEASARLYADPVRFGSSLVLSHSAALEQFQSWVRTEARRNGVEPSRPLLTYDAARPGEQLFARRFETATGKALFLVGFANKGTVESGKTPAEETVLHAACLGREHALTRRQIEVLTHVAAGRSNKVIATLSGRSESTVEFHVTALLAKLGCHNRAEIVARFWRR